MYAYAVNTDDPAWKNTREYLTQEEYKEMRQTIQKQYHCSPQYMVYGGYVQKAAESQRKNMPVIQECFLPEPQFPYIYRITHYFTPQQCSMCKNVCYEMCKNQ